MRRQSDVLARCTSRPGSGATTPRVAPLPPQPHFDPLPLRRSLRGGLTCEVVIVTARDADVSERRL